MVCSILIICVMLVICIWLVWVWKMLKCRVVSRVLCSVLCWIRKLGLLLGLGLY